MTQNNFNRYGRSYLATVLAQSETQTTLGIHRDNPNLLYAGIAGAGVLRSTDAGATLSPFNDGLANLHIRVLTSAEGDPRILCKYAGRDFQDC